MVSTHNSSQPSDSAPSATTPQIMLSPVAPSPKNYEASYGNLVAHYSIGGRATPKIGTPRHSPAPSTNVSRCSSPAPPSTLSSTSHPHVQPSVSAGSSDTVAAASDAKPNPERALGELSSFYGFNSAVPSVPSSVPPSKPAFTTSSTSHELPSEVPTTPGIVLSPAAPSSQKNYEASYGNLVSHYSLGGSTTPKMATPRHSPNVSRSSSPAPFFTPSSMHQTKNYELGSGQHMASYGFDASPLSQSK